MDAAEALAGAELRVDVSALQPLPPGSFYRHDLIGCAVETKDGRQLGEVNAVEGESNGSRLVIKSGGAEILIPLVEGICVSIDTAGRKIVVEPPEGLVELNVTRRQRF
jgi:16S rRNA processing protein RimM